LTIITGDTHGDFQRLSNMKQKPTHVIILGDFGLLWTTEDNQELYWKKWLREKPFEIIALQGNHENFSRIHNLPKVERYGNTVYKYTDNIFILIHGLDYFIDGRHYFCYGGATSLDKASRKENITWWEEEIPNYRYEQQAWDTIENTVRFDSVLTHTAPEDVINELGYNFKFCPVSRLLGEFRKRLVCKQWFFGHLHEDKDIELNKIKYKALYNGLYEVEEKV